jgi:hypothetical protein
MLQSTKKNKVGLLLKLVQLVGIVQTMPKLVNMDASFENPVYEGPEAVSQIEPPKRPKRRLCKLCEL